MGERQAVAFEFERVTVLRAGRRVLDEVTASIRRLASPWCRGHPGPARPEAVRNSGSPEATWTGRRELVPDHAATWCLGAVLD